MENETLRKYIFRANPETEEIIENFHSYGCFSRQELINTAVCFYHKQILNDGHMPNNREELTAFVNNLIDRKMAARRPELPYQQGTFSSEHSEEKK